MEQVLVIDDDSLMLEVLREILELEGYHVLTASGGERGLELVHALHPDVVITDLIMPHKDGVYVINEIRAHAPETRVIALSGTPRVENMTKAVMADANRVIAKPFEQDELLDAVAELMEYSAPRA
jgi:CheY-like chemotaxis protein